MAEEACKKFGEGGGGLKYSAPNINVYVLRYCLSSTRPQDISVQLTLLVAVAAVQPAGCCRGGSHQ